MPSDMCGVWYSFNQHALDRHHSFEENGGETIFNHVYPIMKGVKRAVQCGLIKKLLQLMKFFIKSEIWNFVYCYFCHIKTMVEEPWFS